MSTPAFFATVRVSTTPSCTFHSSSFRQAECGDQQVVDEPVSLRDLAATIVDVAGLRGRRAVSGAIAGPVLEAARAVGARRGKQPLYPRSPRWCPSTRSSAIPGEFPNNSLPLGAVKERDWSYIRRERDVREELFDLQRDPREQHNLAAEPAKKSTLEQMRAALDHLTAGPS